MYSDSKFEINQNLLFAAVAFLIFQLSRAADHSAGAARSVGSDFRNQRKHPLLIGKDHYDAISFAW